MSRSLFHVTTVPEFASARHTGVIEPLSLAEEGFVHCCFRDQIAGVLERYFLGASRLLLVEFDRTRVGRWIVETPPGAKEGFPHVYGALPVSVVRRTFPLPDNGRGFDLPQELRHEAEMELRELGELLRGYEWYDHPEGPKFVETHRDEHRTCGHWLFLPGSISVFHRVLNNEELWIAQRGRLLVHTLDPRGEHVVRTLGFDVSVGEHPVLSVPLGWLQAAELAPGEPFAFGANVCAPPFHFERFELTPRAALIESWPQHRELALRLTHQ